MLVQNHCLRKYQLKFSSVEHMNLSCCLFVVPGISGGNTSPPLPLSSLQEQIEILGNFSVSMQPVGKPQACSASVRGQGI